MIAASNGPARIRERVLTAVAAALGLVLLVLAARGAVEFGLTEALGFVTGAACVWLGVKQNIWNWPIGIANNLFYLVIFVQARLFADASLQVVFALLGAYGWITWLRRGPARESLAVSRTPPAVWAVTGVAVTIATVGLTVYLQRTSDAAPFLDALTTTASMGAQYLQARKFLECWWVWIAIDVISIGLYATKHLQLTAVLYAAYLVMCIVGARSWSSSLAPAPAPGRA